MQRKQFFLLAVCAIAFLFNEACMTAVQDATNSKRAIKLITLDPGHFHSALVQKTMYDEVDPEVLVYAPEGNELKAHLALIEQYNTRSEDPTSWKEKVYSGDDYLEKMLADKSGNLVVIAGNNLKKTEYIKKSVEAKLHVLADKPMAITPENFDTLKLAFESAEKNNVLLYDIMTERYEITNILQKELMHMQEIFGSLERGSLEEPAVSMSSVHHLFKFVSGKPLRRPSWFFDVQQQGSGITDVTTHMVDLVQWQCFPEVILNYSDDIRMDSAKSWPTILSLNQFSRITGAEAFPGYLEKDIKNDSLYLYANGEMNYTIRGVHAKVSVAWSYEAPEGTGDTHFSTIKGSGATLVIRQGKEQQFKPVLYIEPSAKMNPTEFENNLKESIKKLQAFYPGVDVLKTGDAFQVIIPEKFKTGHEAHFSEVTKKFLGFVENGKLPVWEVPNMIAKYYTTTRALELINKNR